MGGLGLGFGLGRDLFPSDLPGTCVYDASSERVNCQPQTRNGLTVTRSAAYADASGAVQQAFDSVTTNTVNMQVAVTGTRTRRDGNASTVEHNSDRTVTGLAQGSTERTVNGTSAGTETTTGTDSVGTFSAGTIIRSMRVSVTYQGQTPTTTRRREVVTFDGSSTAAVEVTEDGVTRSCSRALPHGQLTCS